METLSSNDFRVVNGNLSLDRPGFYAVLFTIKNELTCIDVIDVLSKLTIDHLHLASIDIYDNSNIIKMAKDTKTPIDEVPDLVFFVDGFIKSRYVGRIDASAFTEYLTKGISKTKRHFLDEFVGCCYMTWINR